MAGQQMYLSPACLDPINKPHELKRCLNPKRKPQIDLILAYGPRDDEMSYRFALDFGYTHVNIQISLDNLAIYASKLLRENNPAVLQSAWPWQLHPSVLVRKLDRDRQWRPSARFMIPILESLIYHCVAKRGRKIIISGMQVGPNWATTLVDFSKRVAMPNALFLLYDGSGDADIQNGINQFWNDRGWGNTIVKAKASSGLYSALLAALREKAGLGGPRYNTATKRPVKSSRKGVEVEGSERDEEMKDTPSAAIPRVITAGPDEEMLDVSDAATGVERRVKENVHPTRRR